MKLPRLENQRGYLRCVLVHAASFDLTHEDHVIAFLITAPVMALEPRERAIEHGHACVPGGVRHTRKAVALDRREALAEIDLRRGEHVDHVVTVGLEYGHRCRLCCKAPQYERRIERYGIERAGRDANQLARLGARRDDGDAGGELAERVPESVCIEIRFRCRRKIAIVAILSESTAPVIMKPQCRKPRAQHEYTKTSKLEGLIQSGSARIWVTAEHEPGASMTQHDEQAN